MSMVSGAGDRLPDIYRGLFCYSEVIKLRLRPFGKKKEERFGSKSKYQME